MKTVRCDTSECDVPYPDRLCSFANGPVGEAGVIRRILLSRSLRRAAGSRGSRAETGDVPSAL